ncbi:DDE-type integrase/transposase/recombinase [Agrobacterium burrii]|uniref:DDE-type integrase/transposase/recombinase n=1 Tax=Agrobacterium burrii TaxID=2815339 RepID=A0ABS3ECG0_9HYPH|nr:DDE-type integrase/transposase/recombinase [Agrobacterium burrii]MBO0129641.1 DDE-type integrase/transposase/recombinase [Agrobacterium burrii]
MSVEYGDGRYLQPVKTFHELAIPPDPGRGFDMQCPDIRVGDTFSIFNAEKTRYATFRFTGWLQPAPEFPAVAQFQQLVTNVGITLSIWQIGELNRQGRIRPISGKGAAARNLPGAAATVTDDQHKSAHRRMAYIDACYLRMIELRERTLTRSQRADVIRKVADEINDPKPPCVNSVYNWQNRDKNGGRFDRLLNFVRQGNSGNYGPREGSEVARAMQEAVDLAIQAGGQWGMVQAILMALAQPDGDFHHIRDLLLNEDGSCRLSDRTIQRKLHDLNEYERDVLESGRDYAETKHMIRLRQLRPDAPLEIVDVDHAVMNIVGIDPDLAIAYGRPHILTFRDRYSGVVVGFSISFQPPSYESFFEGLQHMLFEKQIDPLSGAEYPWWGRPLKLGTDNAKHLIGLNLKESLQELGIETVAYRPARGWEKGAEEHLFHILDRAVANRLPGATGHSIAERIKFDKEMQKAMPKMTLPQIRGFLTYYLAYIHHMKPTQGLGDLATFQGIPADVWAEGIKRAPEPPLIDPEIFVRIAGQFADVGLDSKKGFVWNDITYVSPELLFLATQRASKGRKFKARRSPWNLGVAWIQDPYAKTERWLEVPAAPADQPYANGLRYYEHKWIKKYLREKMKKAVNAANLLLAKIELAKAVIAAHKAHGTIKTGRTLASLYARTVGKFAMSRRYKMATVEYGEDYVDLADPAMQEAPPVLSSRAGLVAPFDIPNAKKHDPQVGFEIEGEKASDTDNSSDIDFDEFGGWLV